MCATFEAPNAGLIWNPFKITSTVATTTQATPTTATYLMGSTEEILDQIRILYGEPSRIFAIKILKHELKFRFAYFTDFIKNLTMN